MLRFVNSTVRIISTSAGRHGLSSVSSKVSRALPSYQLRSFAGYTDSITVSAEFNSKSSTNSINMWSLTLYSLPYVVVAILFCLLYCSILVDKLVKDRGDSMDQVAPVFLPLKLNTNLRW
jgi:hypothetical protein